MSSRYLLFYLFLTACSNPPAKNEEGKRLANTYCGSCHEVPAPNLVDKQTWLTGVLPEMGPRLGIRSFQGVDYPMQNHPSVPEGFYPTQPAMTPEEWASLVGYFYDQAPDSLQKNYEPIDTAQRRFVVRSPPYPANKPPVTSYIKIDPGNHGIYAAHGLDLTLRSYDRGLHPVSKVSIHNVMADIAFHDLATPGPRSGTLLTMGALTPYDVTHGSLQPVSITPQLKINLSPNLLMDSLARPVSIQQADLNDDGLDDFVVCGFGNFTGSLFWLKNKGRGKYERIALRNQPGSTQALVADFNKDGKKDILALMAQGDEGIFLYEQLADGSFRERRIMRFSPAAGSISIDLADFNGDGIPDILYTSGDNADFSKILKPYHGVYIYLNDGQWNLTQAYFFEINGAFRAVARDFDLDGDLDIATISFFPDFKKRPEESFVYLENQGKLAFKAFSIPQHSLGRWLTMDAGDLDGDGDVDIVLGNMSIGPTNISQHHDFRSGPDFLLLENKTR